MDKQMEISKEAKFDLQIKQGKLILALNYDGAQVDAGVSVAVGVDLFLDKLAEKIPGQLDDAVIAVIKGALNAL